MRCILIGNYGVANLGDEALKEYFLERFPEVEWQVVSAHPTGSQLYRLPVGVRSAFTPWWKTLGAMRKADAVVFGGGSLFTDVESPLACILWGLHAFAARLLGIPVVLAFQGVGPFRTGWGRGIARWVVKRSVFLSVRDAESARRIEEFNLSTKVVLSSDPIFISVQNPVPLRSQNVFVVIPRQNADGAFFSAFQRLLPTVPGEVHLVALQPDDPQEQEVLATLERQAEGRAVRRIAARTLATLMDEVSAASLVLTQRFHGAIAALSAGVQTEIYPQKQGDKLWALKDAMERGNAVEEVRRQQALALEGERALKAWFAGR